MGLSGGYNEPLPDEVGISVIKHAFSKGITFFDTADVYGAANANEILVGKVTKDLLTHLLVYTLHTITNLIFNSYILLHATEKCTVVLC